MRLTLNEIINAIKEVATVISETGGANVRFALKENKQTGVVYGEIEIKRKEQIK